MASARGIAAIVVLSCNSSCNSSQWLKTIALFLLFECNSSCGIASVKARSKHVPSVVTAASIAVAPLADFTHHRNTRSFTKDEDLVRWPRAATYFQTRSCKIVSHSVV